jgi:hypothetical protein
MFSWPDFLKQYNIAFETQGRHARLPCPFCPPNERHLAIDLGGRGWWCWVGRKAHSGISPARLVAALLHCSLEHAAILTGSRGKPPPIDDFKTRIEALMNETAPEPQLLQWQREFRPFDDSPMAEPFNHYLIKRGFTHSQIATMTRKYELHYCRHGRFRYRIIFPIRHRGKLVAWTGRSIVTGEERRYKAEGPAPHYLLWFDRLKSGGDCIALTEGPFDALKLCVLGLPATCFFTSGPSDQQVDLLYDLLPRYRRRVLLLDRHTLPTAMLTESMLRSMQVEAINLPPHLKDPATIRNAGELQNILTLS